jgi:hypothetical protein
MQKTHSMCGVMVDTLGREIMVRRPFTLDSDGWPQHEEPFAVAAGEAVVMTTQEMWEGEFDESCHPAGVLLPPYLKHAPPAARHTDRRTASWHTCCLQHPLVVA